MCATLETLLQLSSTLRILSDQERGPADFKHHQGLETHLGLANAA